MANTSPDVGKALSAGLTWLVNAIEQDSHRRPAIIGFYPSKIWYHERLYPLVFAAGALAHAVHRSALEQPAAVTVS
jgi:squalene-hopene/tetraprenyl-beta-curcumene cyclase